MTSVYDGIGANARGTADARLGAYRYYAAPIQSSDRGQSSSLFLQNAGAATASVQLWLQAADACDGGALCRTVDIDPGASAVIRAADCVDEGWRGSAWLHSPAPLAITVDTAGRDTLATFTGVAPHVDTDATGAPAFAAQDYAAFGPLVFGPEYGVGSRSDLPEHQPNRDRPGGGDLPGRQRHGDSHPGGRCVPTRQPHVHAAHR